LGVCMGLFVSLPQILAFGSNLDNSTDCIQVRKNTKVGIFF
jgi:hypothetical protein